MTTIEVALTIAHRDFPDDRPLGAAHHMRAGVEVVMEQDSTPLWALVAAALVALMFFVVMLMPGG